MNHQNPVGDLDGDHWPTTPLPRRPRGRAGGRRSAAPQEPLSGEQLLGKWKSDIEFAVSEFEDAPDAVLCELIARLQKIYVGRAERKPEPQS
jgi:hypothetical protein